MRRLYRVSNLVQTPDGALRRLDRSSRRTMPARLRAAAAAVLAAASAVALCLTGPSAALAATPGSVMYTTTGEHLYVVPDGVTAVKVEAIGGHGADGGGDKGGTGGHGGDIVVVLSVTAGTKLYAEVAANGDAGAAGGGGGGYGGSHYGGHGGGASTLQTCSVSIGCADSRLVVAGGGGGGGGESHSGLAGGNGSGAGTGVRGADGARTGYYLVAAKGGATGSDDANVGGAGGYLRDECSGYYGYPGGAGTREGGDAGRSGQNAPGGAGGQAYGGGGGGGASFGGGGGGGGGGAGLAGGGGGGGGAVDMCSQDPAEGGGGGGAGGTNGATVGRILSSTVATTSTPMVSITPLGNQTITFTSTPPAGATVGDAYLHPTATASSRLPVTLTVDPAALGVCVMYPDFVFLFAPGTCIIDANQPGDGNDWTPAPQVQQSFTVSPATTSLSQTVSFTSSAPTDAVVGGTYTPTASATSTLPVTLTIDASSSAVCTISGGVVTFDATGDCVIDAEQPGDADWDPAPRVQQTVAVGKTPQTITFTSSAPTGATVAGPGYSVTAEATSGLPVAISIDPVSWGLCTITDGVVNFVKAGDCVLDAYQIGDDSWAPAPRAQQSFAVGKGAQTIAFTSAAPGDAAVGGAAYTPEATATSGLPVDFSVDPSASGVCELSGATVVFVGGGDCVIDADQAGDDDWTPAPQVQQRFTVASVPAIVSDAAATFTIGKSGSAEIRVSGVPAASITAGGPLPGGVTLVDDGDGTARLSGVPAAGSAGDYPVTITATNRAGSATQAFVLTVARQPSIVDLSGPATATPGSSVTISVRVGGGDPPSGTVELSVGGVSLGTVVLDGSGRARLSTSALPVGRDLIRASYSGDADFAPASGSLVIVVSATAPAGGAGSSGALASTGVDLVGALGAMVALLAMGLGMLVADRRRRRTGGAEN